MNPIDFSVECDLIAPEAVAKLELKMKSAARIAEKNQHQIEPADLFGAFVEYAEDLMDAAIQTVLKSGAGKADLERIGPIVASEIIERIERHRSMERTRPEGEWPESFSTTWDEKTGQTVGYDPDSNQMVPLDPHYSWSFSLHGDFERYAPGRVGIILRADQHGQQRFRLLLTTALQQRLIYWKGCARTEAAVSTHSQTVDALLQNRGLSRNKFYELVAGKASCNERTVQRVVSGATKRPGNEIRKAIAEVLGVGVEDLNF